MVLYRRKKLYGRFYIFTAPPMIDYITRLDKDKSLIEQSNKLPYIAEWEFPRERVQLGEYQAIKIYKTKLKVYKVCARSCIEP